MSKQECEGCYEIIETDDFKKGFLGPYYRCKKCYEFLERFLSLKIIINKNYGEKP